MSQLSKGKSVSLEELMLATLATTDALAKLLIEKGVITDAELTKKLLESSHARELPYQLLQILWEPFESRIVFSKLFGRAKSHFQSGGFSCLFEFRVPDRSLKSSLPHLVNTLVQARRRDQKSAHAPESGRHFQSLSLIRRYTQRICDMG